MNISRWFVQRLKYFVIGRTSDARKFRQIHVDIMFIRQFDVDIANLESMNKHPLSVVPQRNDSLKMAMRQNT